MESDMGVKRAKKFPTLSGYLIVVLLLMMGQIIFGAIFKLALPDNVQMGFFFAYTFSFVIAVVVLLIGQKHVQGDTFVSLFKKFNPQIIPYLLIFVLGFGYVSDFFVSLFPMPDWLKEVFESMVKFDVWSFLSVCIAAPILEELFCRGILLRSFIPNYGVKKAMFLSAFLFAFIHLNPWQAIPAFGVGLFMAWLFYKTGSLLPAIIVHFVNNTIAFVSSSILGADASLSNSVGWEINTALILLGTGLCAYSVLKLRSILRDKVPAEQVQEHQSA